MLADAIDLLRCPHCAGGLELVDGTARCATGHAFDVARQGYLNLLPGDARTGSADTAAMVRARIEFLAAGHYAPIAAAVRDAAAAATNAPTAVLPEPPGADAGGVLDVDAAGVPEVDAGGMLDADAGGVLDVGAGTGYYLAAVLERRPQARGLALDISKHALRIAARAHPRIAAVGCDAWAGLPLRDGAADLAINVFAPRDPAELARVLAPGAPLIVVTPNPGHLGELVAAVGMLTVQERKRERLIGKLGGLFAPVAEAAVERELTLGHGDLAALVAMGPSARHLSEAEIGQKVAALADPLAVTLSVTVVTYRRAAGAPG